MKKILILGQRVHAKASEKYVDVLFAYENGVAFETSVPTEYRRTGTSIGDTDINAYVERVYEAVNPKNRAKWKSDQKAFWESKPGASITFSFFEKLSSSFAWHCVTCELPKNPNFARRIQDLKEFGYTLATNTGRQCRSCNKNNTHLLLLPLPRGGITGYETWSAELRANIIKVLEGFDAYEAKKGKAEGLLPDHKFPEIRWDENTMRDSIEHLSAHEIKRDFQLLSNQRNQQKREVCRNCFQTGKRGTIFGIRFFHKGGPNWDPTIERRGKAAEEGCRGCPWYDIQEWRTMLDQKLSRTSAEQG
jgi:hypothetical protein